MSDWSVLGPHVLSCVRRLENGWSLRSFAVELAGGGHAILSPTRKMDPGALAPRFFVATNHFHWLGIPDWRAKFPDARIAATSVAAVRLREKLETEIVSLADVPLLSGLRWIEPPGIASGEGWLDANGTWFVCDAFFNEPNNPTGAFGLGCRLSGTTPGLRVGRTWRWLHLSKRAEYKSWLLERLQAAPPKRLVPMHGDPIEGDDLGPRLAAAVDSRL